MNQQRLEAERLIYKIMNILDPSERNTQFWIDEFSKMSDEQFKKYISGNYPLYFQTGAFKEPSIKQITDALKEINVPLLESVYMPYKYKNPKTGKPIKSKPCLVVYYHEKRMKQILKQLEILCQITGCMYMIRAYKWGDSRFIITGRHIL